MKPGGISFITQGKERDNGSLLQDGSGEVGEKYSNSGNILKVKLWWTTAHPAGELDVEFEGRGEVKEHCCAWALKVWVAINVDRKDCR